MTCSHDAPLAAVHGQLAPAVTVTAPEPPARGIENSFDETVEVQTAPLPKITNPPE